MQLILDSLTYTYQPSGEPLPGERVIIVAVSDGLFTASITVSVTVDIINNNPPRLDVVLPLITFVEGSPSPLALGAIAGVTITDGDNEDILLMMNANVSLVGTVDSGVESLGVRNETALELLGLAVSGECKYFRIDFFIVLIAYCEMPEMNGGEECLQILQEAQIFVRCEPRVLRRKCQRNFLPRAAIDIAISLNLK